MYEQAEIISFYSVLIFCLSPSEAAVSSEGREGTLALLKAPDPVCHLSPAGVIEYELSEILSLRKV